VASASALGAVNSEVDFALNRFGPSVRGEWRVLDSRAAREQRQWTEKRQSERSGKPTGQQVAAEGVPPFVADPCSAQSVHPGFRSDPGLWFPRGEHCPGGTDGECIASRDARPSEAHRFQASTVNSRPGPMLSCATFGRGGSRSSGRARRVSDTAVQNLPDVPTWGPFRKGETETVTISGFQVYRLPCQVTGVRAFLHTRNNGALTPPTTSETVAEGTMSVNYTVQRGSTTIRRA
jgi:hypothetical protein